MQTIISVSASARQYPAVFPTKWIPRPVSVVAPGTSSVHRDFIWITLHVSVHLGTSVFHLMVETADQRESVDS